MNDNYTFNGLNQIASKNGTSFSYDARGNLTNDGVKSYVYNAENMLTSATQAGVTSTLSYDAQNRLASITKNGITTKFIYDGIDLIAEYDGNNNLLRKYVHGGGIDEPLVWYEGIGTSDKRFLISDHQGSVIATTNAAGTVLNISTYSPYGERTNTNAAYASRFGYTGQQIIPEAKLYYYKARVYDPNLGVFLQTDPIGTKDDLNLYAYVKGDPINHVDPDGMQAYIHADGKARTKSEEAKYQAKKKAETSKNANVKDAVSTASDAKSGITEQAAKKMSGKGPSKVIGVQGNVIAAFINGLFNANDASNNVKEGGDPKSEALAAGAKTISETAIGVSGAGAVAPIGALCGPGTWLCVPAAAALGGYGASKLDSSISVSDDISDAIRKKKD